jgi:hypothetical protein
MRTSQFVFFRGYPRRHSIILFNGRKAGLDSGALHQSFQRTPFPFHESWFFSGAALPVDSAAYPTGRCLASTT